MMRAMGWRIAVAAVSAGAAMGAMAQGAMVEAGQATPVAEAGYSGPGRVIVPLARAADGKLYFTARVNGRPMVLFVDTGAASILDEAVVRGMGLVPQATGDLGHGLTGGTIERRSVRVTMTLGGLTLRGVRVDCMDLGTVRALSRANGMPAYDGLIGGELLHALRAVIDYERATLTVRRPG